MLGLKSQNVRTVIIASISAAVTATVIATAPTIAASFDANNAHKVDGLHAVQSSASVAQRKGKLVGTSPNTGKLPNSIIAKAPNSAKLGGKPASAYDKASRFQDSGMEAIGVGTSEDLLAVGPITYSGKCTDLTGGEYRLEIQATSSEAGSIAAFPKPTALAHLTDSPQTLVYVEGADAAFSDGFRVVTPSGIDHLVSVVYRVKGTGSKCTARVRLEKAI